MGRNYTLKVIYTPWFDAAKITNFTAGQSNATLSGLLNGVPANISVAVVATSDDNIAEFVCDERLTGPISYTPPKAYPSSAPSGLIFVASAPLSVTVQWTTLDPAYWGSGSVAYIVSFSTVLGQPQVIGNNANQGTSITYQSGFGMAFVTATISVPQPHVNYSIRVTAFNSAGYGPSSAAIQTTSAEDGQLLSISSFSS